MTLPSSGGGNSTQQVGYFDVEAPDLAEWMVLGFKGGWRTRPGDVTSMREAVALLAPGTAVTRYLCVPVGRWTALLSNGPLGTDVGVLPSYAARELGRRAIRVVIIDDNAAMYPARVLEVFGPQGASPLAIERSLVAANDGGRWVFETSGAPYPFEDQAAYLKRSKADRFTTNMVFDYLKALDVPIDADVDWVHALLVERLW